MAFPPKRRSDAAPPPPAIAAFRNAIAAHKSGRLSLAIDGYRHAVKMAPNFAEGHYNLGVALRAAGQAGGAEKALLRAVRLRPDYGRAHMALAGLYDHADASAKALRHWLSASRLMAGDLSARNGLVRAIGRMRFTEADPRLSEVVTELLCRNDVEGQLLLGAALSLLALEPGVSDALANADPTPLLDAPPSPLLSAVLERTIVADRQWEALLTALRGDVVTSFNDLDDARAPLIRALAVQMLATDYAYGVSAAESAALAKLDLSGTVLTPSHVLWSLYEPLAGRVTALEAPYDWLGFVETHVTRPQGELAAAKAVPALTEISDTVSLGVRGQYLDLPYPRWTATRAITALPRKSVLSAITPIAARGWPADPPRLRILVAGCGTGKHAVEVATRFANSDVLAIDLSQTSLGYAKAQSDRMGLSNITFAEADILQLAAVERRFDHIEAVGVLHHLADPSQGWRVLRGMLDGPGATMRIGLYARNGRRAIQAAQSLAKGYEPSREGLRAFRQAVLALPSDHPAAPVASELDFYTLSGVRDAFAHVQEHDFTLLEINRLLSDLALRFLAFETVTRVPQRAYSKHYPNDPAQTDLDQWHVLEQDHPDLFHLMYQFWCAPASAPAPAPE